MSSHIFSALETGSPVQYSLTRISGTIQRYLERQHRPISGGRYRVRRPISTPPERLAVALQRCMTSKQCTRHGLGGGSEGYNTATKHGSAQQVDARFDPLLLARRLCSLARAPADAG